MMSPMRDVTICLLSLSLAGSVETVSAQERDRSKIPEKYKWNLADIYPNDAAWKAGKEKFVGDLKSVVGFRGTLAESSGKLLACLDYLTNLSKEYARLSIFASLQSDQDTRDASHLAATQEMGQIGSEFAAATAFLQPEILAMARPVLESFLKKEPRLGVYRHMLDDIQRRKAHTGSEGEEKIIADASLMSDAPSSVYTIFSNADFPFPDVTLHDGTAVKLDKAGFNLYRAAQNRDDRKNVFSAYFGRLNEYRRTFGTELYGEVKKDMFYMRAQKYSSCLESALDGSNIPVDVYRSLIKNVDDNLTTFHRYLNLRKRLLGVDQLHYYDLYVPMVGAVDLKYSVEDAEKYILESVAPLGNAYAGVMKKAFADRWIDVYPNTGKVAGAYSSGGVYDVHPYMLLNYNGKYDDMSTLAHELGHTMHSYLANTTQPYATSQYSIFVAEVASTFNEALLMNTMLREIKDDNVRLNLLGSYLDNVRGTLFRQVQFAEFELAIHEMAERGETLTGDALNALYLALVRKYYGHAKGVCIVDDDVQSEWANIPHFYYNFYVYQYATSFTASSALSEEYFGGDQTAPRRLLELLSAGGSDYPIPLLKKAGVDMTTSQPFTLMMKKMNRVMDEMENILAKRTK